MCDRVYLNIYVHKLLLQIVSVRINEYAYINVMNINGNVPPQACA